MIRALVRAGKKVGVTAVSHKVIRNLLDAVREAGGPGWRDGLDGVAAVAPRIVDDESEDGDSSRTFSDKMSAALTALADGASPRPRRHRLALGARGGGRDRRRPVRGRSRPDVAGQRARRLAARPTASCCSAIRSSSSSRRRAAIPTASASPRWSTSSAAPRRCRRIAGCSCPTTWRLHPAICAFTSEVFYEGKLAAEAGLERQRSRAPATSTAPACGGCPSRTTATRTRRRRKWTRWSASWTQLLGGAGAAGQAERGRRRRRRPSADAADLRVVAPYNAQVNRLAERLAGARRPRRHRGQVPGPGGAGRDLLDGHVAAGRRAARDGVPLQPQSPERRHVAGPMRGHRRGARRGCSSPSAARRGRCGWRTRLCRYRELSTEVE